MTSIPICSAQEINARPDTLSELWSADPFFLVVADKRSVNMSWLKDAVKQFPSILRFGTFGLLTSGSTGSPKLIIGKRKRAVQLVELLHELQESEPCEETLCTLPLSYSYAFINQWLWSKIFERRLVISNGLSTPEEFLNCLSNAENSMLCLVGSQVPVMRSLFGDTQFDGIIRLHFAGERFPNEHMGYLKTSFPNARIFNNYGCSEALPRLTVSRIDHQVPTGSVGFPLPGIEMRSTSTNEIEFRSPYGAIGYVEHSSLTLIHPEDWVKSGDLGEQLPGGQWCLTGRNNEVFKRYGEKVSLPQLVTAVAPIFDGEVACYRDRDSRGEEAGVLVLSPGPDIATQREILKTLGTQFSRPHWPIRIESMESLPRLPNGKIDVQALKDAEDKKLHWRQRI